MNSGRPRGRAGPECAVFSSGVSWAEGEAIAHYEKALSLQPNFLDPLFRLASIYVQQKIIKKRVNINYAWKLIEFTRSKGVFTSVNIVIGSPGETKELMDETFEFLRTTQVDWITFFIAYPYPGTAMTEALLARGEITEDKLIEVWDNSTQGFRERPFDTAEISGKELFERVYNYNIMLNFFHNYNFKSGNYSIIISKLDKIITNHPWHVVAVACIAKCYYELGQRSLALSYAERIPLLVRSEPLSTEMYIKYKDRAVILLTWETAST